MGRDSDDLSAPALAAGACVPGPSHSKLGLPCQDRFGFCAPAPGAVLVVVADGLGSAPLGGEGAEAAVAAALDAGSAARCDAELADTVILMAIAARAALEQLAVLQARPLRDLGCTLIAVAARGDEVCAAHVGDGGAAALVGDGVAVLSPPADSEYADIVDPLTSDGWQECLRVTPVVQGARCVAVFTDGCQRAALRKGPGGFTAHDGFLRPLFEYALETGDADKAAADIQGLLDGTKMREHSDDDKTMVLAVLSG